MRRIIFCGLQKFPRGGAYANYTQYFADALISVGYDVTMICELNPEYTSEKAFEYHGIHLREIFDKNNTVFSILLNGKLFSLQVKKKLKKLDLTPEDLLIFPSVAPIAYPIYDLKERLGFKTAGTPLEWFGREHYDTPEAADAAEALFRLNERHDLLFPISRNIANQFPNMKKLVLPIMADTQEYKYKEKEINEPIEIILPANGSMKDALDSMLHGFADLSEAEIERFRFHLTGIKKETVLDILGSLWQKVEKFIVIHSWMLYDELVDLYTKANYLFLARETSQMTISNFPSKVPEVMTYGIVPLCSRVGDYTDLYLTDKVDSIQIDGCSRSDCCDALRQLLSINRDEYLRLSNGARICAESKFDYRVWADRIRNSIEEIFGEK